MAEADTHFKVINSCVDCGINMGDANPRQLCGKTVCLNTAFYDINLQELSNDEGDNKECYNKEGYEIYKEEPKMKKGKRN